MEEKKIKQYELTDLPFRLTIKLLNSFYTFNYTKQFCKSVIRNNEFYKTCSTFKDLTKFFFLRTFYGYFKLDNFRNRFLLFKTVKLKDFVCSSARGNFKVISNKFFLLREFRKLMMDSLVYVEEYINVSYHDNFFCTKTWILPKFVKRLIYVFEIGDHQTSHISISTHIKFLKLVFRSNRGDENTSDHLDCGILERLIKKRIYPKVVFENFIFGFWGMYYFIKYFNDLKNFKWEIVLKDCYFDKDGAESEIGYLLGMDKISDKNYKKKVLKIIEENFNPNLEKIVFENGFEVKLINCD